MTELQLVNGEIRKPSYKSEVDVMKKVICFCVVLCIALLAGCQSGQSNGIEDGDLIPVGARSMTISYNDYAGDAAEPELKTYRADRQQFRQFCELIKASRILPLTDNDVLSFSTIAYRNAADISVEFDSGDPLYIYAEGGMSRFSDNERNGLSEPEYYFVSQDVIHQLQKILIPEFESDYQTLSPDPDYVKANDNNPGDVNEIPLFISQERKVFPCADGFIAFSRVWDGSDTDSFLRVVKYDGQGNVLWTQNYTDIKLERHRYRFSDCIQTKDGGLAFIVNGDHWFRTAGSRLEVVITLGWLVKCDKDGDIIWKEQLEFVGSAGDTRIFETVDGSILTAETCQTDDGEHYKTGDSAYGSTDLLFRKYDETGERVATKKYGWSQSDSFRGACYSVTVKTDRHCRYAA
jgi:hypothetical protein